MNFIRNSLQIITKTSIHAPRFSLTNFFLPTIRTFSTQTKLPVGVIEANSVRLNNLSDNEGAKKKRKRVGRGIGSGKGKTAGRGHKGQKSRSGGGPHPGFEGGQTPLYKRMRKFGFTNKQFAREYEVTNLENLRYFIEKGRLDLSKLITMKDLVDGGVFSNIKQGVKILGRGSKDWNIPIKIEVSSISAKAKDAIIKAGGQVTTAYYNRIGLRYLLQPEKFKVKPKRVRPPPKLMGKFDDYGFIDPTIKQNKKAESM